MTSSLTSTENAEKKEPYGSPQPLPSPPPSSGNPYPILVRLSSDGQDITIQLPTEPPYLSVAALKQQLLLYTTASNIKLIYLGRILSDQYLIAPTGSPITPKNHKTTIIQIQKECVLQAMVSKVPWIILYYLF